MIQIATENAPAAIGPYCQATVHNGFVFTSGQIPLDPATGQLAQATIQAQAAQSLTNLKAIVEQAGGTLDNIVKTTVFLKDMNDFVEMNRVYKTFFAADCPARSAVQVAKLPKDVMVEIEAIAVL